MQNFVSPCNHPESYLSGSTVQSMIDKTAELGIPYFACTDHGALTAVLKAFNYCKKSKNPDVKNIQVIPGIELYFKDKQDPFKYSKIIIHAKDQEAYQAIVRLSSDSRKSTVGVGTEYHSVYGWEDLEKLSKYNVTACTSNVECMVTKYLLIDRPDLAEKTLQRLLDIFGKDLYLSIVPVAQDKYWNSLVKATVGGLEVTLPAMNRVESDRHYDIRAIELVTNYYRHKKIKAFYMNGIRFKVKPEYQDIDKVEVVNQFQSMQDVQTQANKFMLEMADKNIMFDRLLFNNYSYYANEGDKVVQDMKLGDEKRVYQKQHIMSTEEIVEYAKSALEMEDHQIETVVKNSYRWAKEFDNCKLKYDYKLPIPEGNPEQLLMQRIKDMGRMNWEDERYKVQLKEEFNLLTKNGVINLIPYFLPIIDIYEFYASNGFLTGPARGSAGGFLISYLIGITHVDPIKYGLDSSRFLTLDRVQSGNLPDIDCDLESRVPLVGKDGNSGYLFKKYGKKAAQVSTRTLLRIKSAILDANRFMNKGSVEDSVAALSKSLPNTPQGVSDQKFVFGYEEDGNHVEGLLDTNKALKKYSESRPEEWNIVKRALSLSRQHSRHACAFIISDSDVEDTVPIMEVGGVKRVTQPEHKDCESAGLIKYDFLVVSALKDINLCLKYINKRHGDKDMPTGYFKHNGEKTYVWDLPEDQYVFNMLTQGKTETVFQLNTAGATPTVMKVGPTSIIDCATITSLERPGPKDFRDAKTGRNMVEEYIERKFGRSKADIPILDEMLPETYGVLVFQEQVTKLAKELAGMNVEDSENVRIAVGKKKEDLINSLKPVFIKGAAEKVGEETATEIWGMMETFARYGFNKSHAVAYSIISYACAFLKYHYELEWWAAVLSNASDKEINEVFYQYIKDMVLPPDVNTSTEQMEVDYDLGKIRNKLSVISGLGKKSAEKIIAGRPYKDLYDFVNRKVCGPALARRLIYVGALDSLFPPNSEDLTKLSMYEEAAAQVKFDQKIKDYKSQINELVKSGAVYKEIEKVKKRMERYKEKGPKVTEIPEEFIGINSKKAYQIKKSVFPTINLDLTKALEESSSLPINKTPKGNFLITGQGELRLFKGEHLQRLDNMDVNQEVYMCVPAYIIDTSVFPYQKGSRKALKIIVDSSGYVSEKVIWPDYDTGELLYDPAIKKGAIVYVLYSKRPGKSYTNISKVIVEEESILS